MYKIYLDEMQKETVLVALGSWARGTRNTLAHKKYAETYKEIQKQIKGQKRL